MEDSSSLRENGTAQNFCWPRSTNTDVSKMHYDRTILFIIETGK